MYMKKAIFLCWIAICSMSIPGCNKQPEPTARKDASIISSHPSKIFFSQNQTDNSKLELPLTAEYACEIGSIRFQLPEDGIYSIDEYINSKSEFGIHFRVNEQMDGQVSVLYHKNFAVCGTELEETKNHINGMPVRIGIYDNQPYWDFIALTDTYDGSVIIADKPASWWEDYGQQVMQILETLSICPKSP